MRNTSGWYRHNLIYRQPRLLLDQYPQTYHGGEAYALELRGADLGYTINPQATLLGSVGASIRCVKE